MFLIKFSMNYDEISKRLEEIRTEDFIWIIYVAIIFLSWISNHVERKYFLNNDLKAREDYRKIMLIIFSTITVIYIYFFKDAIDSLNELKPNDSKEKKVLTYLSFIASLLVLISGFIYLYIIINDQDINVELAFN